ncbi:MAG: hypothetical protein EON52_02500 [Actinomycetales bacterium]|nr:MAG: hypothetical protein EON52_02500 [Actinomycetales bacterium]
MYGIVSPRCRKGRCPIGGPMTAIDHPRPVPPLETMPDARAVTSGVRTCATLVSDTAEVMHANAAPAGFEGDPAEISHHAMTTTAREAETTVAALQHGLVALDAFCDRSDVLRSERARLVERHTGLESAAHELERRQDAVTEHDRDPGLVQEVENHRQRVDVLDHDTDLWTCRVAEAEDRLVATLRRADTVHEGTRLGLVAPDVSALVVVAESLAADPAAVHVWWLALTRAQREALKVARPELVGNLDGIPLADRDESNRAHLSALYRTLLERREDGDLSAREAHLLDEVVAVRGALQRALDPSQAVAEPATAFLMLFDPEAARDDGFGAIAYGDPETADHVSVNVPGFSSRLGSIGAVADAAANVQRQASLLDNGTVASIAWLGYDAPDLGASVDGLGAALHDARGVIGEDKARVGAERLSRFVDGLSVNHHGPVHLTVVGHSYGSTTVAIAASRSMDADDVVLAGSPGAGAGNDRASDLHGRVHVASADEDPISRLGSKNDTSLGVDPADRDFGATRIRADSQADTDLRSAGQDIDLNHGSYFRTADELERRGAQQRESRSLDNIAAVVADRGTLETVPARSGNLDWWVKHMAEAGRETLIDSALHGGLVPFIGARVAGLP